MERQSSHFLFKEDPDMGLEENPVVFCHFLRCPEDSSGCASKCFYKGCFAAHIGKNLCSLEISVVLQSHLPQIEPFQVHPSILAVSHLTFWKLVLDNEWIYLYRLKIAAYCCFIFKQETS